MGNSSSDLVICMSINSPHTVYLLMGQDVALEVLCCNIVAVFHPTLRHGGTYGGRLVSPESAASNDR